MALQFAFRLGSLAFATTLLRLAFESVPFEAAVSEAFAIGLLFSGIGFAIGEISRHMMEELAVRELAISEMNRDSEVKTVES